MAGGSQIIIDDQGITIKTNGQAVFKAAQHSFQTGEAVLMPQTALAMYATDYSNQFHYSLNMQSTAVACQQQACSSYVIDRQSGQLLASGHSTTAQGISTHRVFSEARQGIMGVLCLSDQLRVQPQSPESEQQHSHKYNHQHSHQQMSQQDQRFRDEDPLLFEALFGRLNLDSDG